MTGRSQTLCAAWIASVVQVTEGLKDQCVGFFLGERGYLFTERLEGVLPRKGTDRSELYAERAYGGSDENFASGCIRGCARQTDAGSVDSRNMIAKAVGLQFAAIRAKGSDLRKDVRGTRTT